MPTVRKTVESLQKDLTDNAHKVWLAGVGAYATVEEEGKELLGEGGDFFDRLVTRGREMQQKGSTRFERTRSEMESNVDRFGDRVSGRVEKAVASTLERLGVPTRNEVRTLSERVRALSKQIEALGDAMGVEPAVATPKARKSYHVAPHEDGWEVKLEGASRATSVHATKDEATGAARELARKNEPSQVVIHRLDGTVQSHTTYGELD